MKKICLILLATLLLYAGKLGAQPYQSIFGKDSTRWETINKQRLAEVGLPPYVQTNWIHNGEVAIFDTLSYKKIKHTYGNYIYMREDTTIGAVWIYDSFQSKEFLFYDYSLDVGDTFHFPSTYTNGYTTCKTVVDSVRFINNKKHIYLTQVPYTCIEFTHGNERDSIVFTMIEGTGANSFVDVFYDRGVSYVLCAVKDGVKTDYTNRVHEGSCKYEYVNIQKINTLQGIRLSPNPARFSIDLSYLPNKPCHISLYDMMGRAVLQRNINGTAAQLDISSIPPGLYMFRISAAGYTPYYTKIVKE